MIELKIPQRSLIIAVALVAGIWVLFQLWSVVLLVITAVIFMTALAPYVSWLERRGVQRTAAVLLILFVLALALAALLFAVVPAMIDEFQHLQDDLPNDAHDLDRLLGNFGIHTDLESRARDFQWSDVISGRAAFDYGQQGFFILFSVLTVIVMTVYLLIDLRQLEAFLFQFVSPGNEPRVIGVLEALSRVVGGYIRGQFITSLIITVYTFIACFAVGTPNPIAFAVLAGFADIIPIAGPFLSIGPATLATLRESTTQALIIAGLLTLYQQFEDRFLAPRVYSRTLNLPPLIVLLAVLAGGELLGVAGVLLALPAAAAARVFIDFYLEQRRAIPAVPAAPADEILAPDER